MAALLGGKLALAHILRMVLLVLFYTSFYYFILQFIGINHLLLGVPTTWTKITIPFSDIGWTPGTPIQGFWIQAQIDAKVGAAVSLCIIPSSLPLIYISTALRSLAPTFLPLVTRHL